MESIEELAEFMCRTSTSIPRAKMDNKDWEIVEVGAHRRGIVEELEEAQLYIRQLHMNINTLEERLA